MRLRGFLGVVSAIALSACVVATHDRDRESPIPGAGSSGSGGTAGSAGSSGAGAAGFAGTSGTAGRASDAGTDVGSGGNGDASPDSAADSGTGGTAGDAGDGGGTGGTADAGNTDGGSGNPTLGVQCNAIISACPGIALAQCQLYLGGLTATARAYVVSCMSSGCSFANCVRDL